MPNIKVEPTIPNYPPQGIQAQLDLLYLWNPDVANDLIEQLNKALEEVAADLSAYLTKDEAAATYATQTEVTQLSGTVEEVSNKADTLDSDLKELGEQVQGLQQSINGKQDALTTEQLAAVNSGITSAKVASYDAYAGEISTAQSTADKADNAAEVAQQTANLAGQNAAQALSGLTGKVNINQGADNAGKVMTVGEDGNLAPADAPSSSLPDQTGNAGKFLTTDGSNVSWKDALVNNAYDKTSSVALGYKATAPNNNSVCVGVWSGSIALGGIAIGSNSYIEEHGAVQINSKPNGDRASNTEANTFKWQNDNGNFTLFDANGIIPSERIATIPAEDGVYTAQITVSGGVATTSWSALDVYSKEETDQQIQNAIGTIETALAEV